LFLHNLSPKEYAKLSQIVSTLYLDSELNP